MYHYKDYGDSSSVVSVLGAAKGNSVPFSSPCAVSVTSLSDQNVRMGLK